MTCFDQLGEMLDLDWLNFQERQKRMILNSIERGNALAAATRAAIEEINRLAEQQSNKVRLARNNTEREQAVMRSNALNGLLTQMHMAILSSGQILPPESKPAEPPSEAKDMSAVPPNKDVEEDLSKTGLGIGKSNPQSNVF